MRAFIAVLVLIFSFQSLSKADDIRDFEIEGMSIGDSALDYVNETNIKKNIINFNTDEKFTMFCLNDIWKEYDRLCLVYRSDDISYTIHSISAQLIYSNKDISHCHKKQKEVDSDVSNNFKNLKRTDWGVLVMDERTLKIDPTAKYKPITYDFKNNYERLQISCYDFKKSDRLKVILYTEDYGKHIEFKATKVN